MVEGRGDQIFDVDESGNRSPLEFLHVLNLAAPKPSVE